MNILKSDILGFGTSFFITIFGIPVVGSHNRLERNWN